MMTMNLISDLLVYTLLRIFYVIQSMPAFASKIFFEIHFLFLLIIFYSHSATDKEITLNLALYKKVQHVYETKFDKSYPL